MADTTTLVRCDRNQIYQSWKLITTVALSFQEPVQLWSKSNIPILKANHNDLEIQNDFVLAVIEIKYTNPES